MSNKINVILVDDHEMVRLGLKSFLNLQGDIEVVGEAGNGREGVDLALELRPDVVVMDLVMPELDGVQATLELLKEWPEAKILVLTSYLDNEKIYPVIDLLQRRQYGSGTDPAEKSTGIESKAGERSSAAGTVIHERRTL